MAGNEFILKTCPRVIRKLLRWMREKLVALTNEEIKEMCENQLWEDTVRTWDFKVRVMCRGFQCSENSQQLRVEGRWVGDKTA